MLTVYMVLLFNLSDRPLTPKIQFVQDRQDACGAQARQSLFSYSHVYRFAIRNEHKKITLTIDKMDCVGGESNYFEAFENTRPEEKKP